MIDFSAELNKEQLDVVLHGDGPCLVLAGAGSGKTRTITYRVAYLLEQGVPPENILLVTFTNKAAEEMKTRISNIEYRISNAKIPNVLPWSGTFHHIGYRILRIYAPLLGYGSNFTVLDSDDSESLLKLCIKETRGSDTAIRFPSAGLLQAVISYARNAERALDEVLEMRYEQWLHVSEAIKEMAHEYAKRKKEANAMDFDDLLLNLLTLLSQPSVHKKYAEQFQYVLVDEYQDTNKIQASIIKKFSSIHKNILVVGDDAQSIYSFRAADIQNILQFPQEYPGAKIFKLETNYRSTEEILEVANSVIANNREQYRKQLRTLVQGVKPALFPQIDQQSEAHFVFKKISEHLRDGVPPQEIAVLFRAAHHSQMLEVELVQNGIEYDYRGGVRFFERAHIKDILAYLRIFNNLADTAAWLRVLMHEEGIGPAAAQKVIDRVRQINNVEQVSQVGVEVLGSKAQAGWNNFLAIWNQMTNTPQRAPHYLIEALAQSPYRRYLESEYIDARDRLDDIKQLALFAERYDSMDEFLADATLQESFRKIVDEPASNGRDAINRVSTEPEKGKIILSTIHQAKGLEWTVVFIINLSAGGFPSERARREANGLEEERRLFYVAITRAKKHLYLTYPMAGGAFGDFLAGPSLFLNEIESNLLEDHSLLSSDPTVLDDPLEDVRYVSEDRPRKIRPGSFLSDIEDL